jgi:dienelactone hydrolase
MSAPAHLRAVLAACFLFALIALAPPAPAVAQTDAGPDGLAGNWTGTWVRDGDALPVTMNFTRKAGGYEGAFDSDALQVAAIPLSAIAATDGKVRFEIRGDQSTSKFDGRIADGDINGTFTDGDAAGSFHLVRALRPAPAVKTRDVTFTAGAARLSGTLVLPATPGRHPGVLFLQGSGPEGRWANRYLAQKFAQAGIAALIYDKEGVGQSTGDWRKADFGRLADDAAAGIAFLRAQAEVDPARVGIYGHSQGGTIAPLVAERAGRIAFVIASAAVGADPAAAEIYSVGNAIGLDALPPAERADAKAYIEAVVDVGYRGKDRAMLDTASARFKARPWHFAPPDPDDIYWRLAGQDFRPAPHWRRLKAPVLLVYGAHDERVPPR